MNSSNNSTVGLDSLNYPLIIVYVIARYFWGFQLEDMALYVLKIIISCISFICFYHVSQNIIIKDLFVSSDESFVLSYEVDDFVFSHSQLFV